MVEIAKYKSTTLEDLLTKPEFEALVQEQTRRKAGYDLMNPALKRQKKGKVAQKAEEEKVDDPVQP